MATINNTDFLQKQYIFGTVEKIFKRHIGKYPKTEINGVICCDEEQENEMITLADRIKLISPYNNLTNYDLYLTLIFIYYSLLEEQANDVFKTRFLMFYAMNKPLVRDLFFKLTTGDIIESDGNNLSQTVRRGYMGFERIGGKKNKHKKTNYKRNKYKPKQKKIKQRYTRKYKYYY